MQLLRRLLSLHFLTLHPVLLNPPSFLHLPIKQAMSAAARVRADEVALRKQRAGVIQQWSRTTAAADAPGAAVGTAAAAVAAAAVAAAAAAAGWQRWRRRWWSN